MPAPTIRDHLKVMPGWVWACRSGCGCIKAVPLYPIIARYGLDITLTEARLRMRCGVCGEPPESFSLSTYGRADAYRFPPLERVPAALRGFARIDPSYIPAPLRAVARRA